MGKKNEFIFTIGLNPNDPNHVSVANKLNNLGRGMAQFIVNAVLAFESGNSNLGALSGHGLDYERIKTMVYQILEEKQVYQNNMNDPRTEQQNDLSDEEESMAFSLDDVSEIIQSIDSFRS